MEADEIARLKDQERLRRAFQENLQRTREKEDKARYKERVLQEYRWLVNDMHVERMCRKQEQAWRRTQSERQARAEERRQELLSQSEEALHIRYGKIFELVEQAEEAVEGATPQGSRSSSHADTAQAPHPEKDASEASRSPEELRLDAFFLRTYREAVGRCFQMEGVTSEAGQVEAVPQGSRGGISSRGGSAGPRYAHGPESQCSDEWSDTPRARGAHAAEARQEIKTKMQVGPPPGKAAWQSRRNPWHWPRKGGLQPMEATVAALLEGRPPLVGEDPTPPNYEALTSKPSVALPLLSQNRRPPPQLPPPVQQAVLGQPIE